MHPDSVIEQDEGELSANRLSVRHSDSNTLQVGFLYFSVASANQLSLYNKHKHR